MIDLDIQINAFAELLIEKEKHVRPRGNKRSDIEYEKFVLSTAWLCKKLLLINSAHKDASIHISRDKNRYKSGRYVPKGISHRVTIEGVLDLMEILGYVDLITRGNYSRQTGKGEQTTYKPTKAFIDYFNVVNSLLPKRLAAFDNTENVVLQITQRRKLKWKDGKPKHIPVKVKKEYADTPQIIQWRDNLTIINDCLRRHWSDLCLPDADFNKLQLQLMRNSKYLYSPIQLHRQTLRRSFSKDTFDEGGRFYGGWWQNIPSAYRSFITIDGKFTDEFDYGRLNPTMLYAEKGLICESDAYDIGIGKEHRDVVKEAFNAMVQMKKDTNRPPNDIDFDSTGLKWKDLKRLILKRHQPIKDSFFCNKGNALQFKDSQIAEQVMLHFAKLDIPILPVHDSFIITRGLFSELITVMRNEFEKQIGVAVNIDDSAKVIPMSFGPEEVDTEHLLSETYKYSAWETRNPL
tara:strand:- start:78 stop:1463 length:1386 start_codon:yes stop_codon:yes gene_type:complete